MAKAIGPQSIGLLLQGKTSLKPLSQRARQWQQGDEGPRPVTSQHLPPAMASRVQLLRDGDTLLLLAENNAVAQLLRFHGPALAAEQGLKDWKVRVSRLPAAISTGPSESRLTPPVLASNAPACLHEAADAIDDPDLKAALRRLADAGQP